MPKKTAVSLDEPLWTTEQVAEFLQMKPRSVHNLRYRGELPFIRFSHTNVKFVPADVRAFAAARRIAEAA